MYYMITTNELYHHGIKGMHWGIRRFQPYGEGYDGSTGKFVGKKSSLGRAGKAASVKSGIGNLKKMYKSHVKKSIEERTFDKREVAKSKNTQAKANVARAAAGTAMAIGAATLASAYAVYSMKKGKNTYALATGKKGPSAYDVYSQAKSMMQTLKGPVKNAAKVAVGSAVAAKLLNVTSRSKKTMVTSSKREAKALKKEMNKYRPDEKASTSLVRSANKGAIRTGVMAASTVATAGITSAATVALLRKGKPATALLVKEASKYGVMALKGATAASAIKTGMDYTAAAFAKGAEKSSDVYKKKKGQAA